MRLTLEVAPGTDPVDLASAKRHCRVDYNDDDLLITSLIAGVASHVDGPSGILGWAIMPQVWVLELTGWFDQIVLPVEPVRSVVVTYTDTAGSEVTLDGSSYALSAWPSSATEWRFVSGAARPNLGDVEYPVKITISAGYESAAEIPSDLRTGLMMLVAHWYANREAVVAGAAPSTVPLAFDSLVAPYRRYV